LSARTRKPVRSAPWRLLFGAASEIAYGGQACIEGVLMKGPRHAALAVRRRDGRIEVLQRDVTSRFPQLVKLPLLRGFFILWDMMTLGTWALRESSHRYELDLQAEEDAAKGQDAGPVPTGAAAEPPVPGIAQQLMLVVSLAFALFLFKVLPAMAATWFFNLFGWGPLAQIATPTFGQQLLANVVEGIVKLVIFVGYIWLVGRIAEIGRVFEYHGAEHIVINAFEDDPANQDMRFIQSHGVAHPRCGTSFLAIMILLGVLLYAVIDFIFVKLGPGITAHLPAWWLSAQVAVGKFHLTLGPAVQNNIPAWWIRWPLRILCLPLLAGLSYEVIRSAFKYYEHPLLRPLLRFGMLFQVLTVRRPSDDQVEVSLASFNRVKQLTEAAHDPPGEPEMSVP
jgi:uncharacterized protein YqhQ